MCSKRTSHKLVENVCVWFSLTGKEFKDVLLTLTTKHSASFLFSHLNSQLTHASLFSNNFSIDKLMSPLILERT